jgi:hypothetical protein
MVAVGVGPELFCESHAIRMNKASTQAASDPAVRRAEEMGGIMGVLMGVGVGRIIL